MEPTVLTIRLYMPYWEAVTLVSLVVTFSIVGFCYALWRAFLAFTRGS